MVIREIIPSDAEGFIHLTQQVEGDFPIIQIILSLHFFPSTSLK